MSLSPFTSEEFSVLHFALESSPEGKLVQRMHTCGVYRTIEEAFVAARMRAVREAQRLRAEAPVGVSAAESAAPQWQILDTEFGYDLKKGFLVVARFWIHAREITRAGGA